MSTLCRFISVFKCAFWNICKCMCPPQCRLHHLVKPYLSLGICCIVLQKGIFQCKHLKTDISCFPDFQEFLKFLEPSIKVFAVCLWNDPEWKEVGRSPHGEVISQLDKLSYSELLVPGIGANTPSQHRLYSYHWLYKVGLNRVFRHMQLSSSGKCKPYYTSICWMIYMYWQIVSFFFPTRCSYQSACVFSGLKLINLMDHDFENHRDFIVNRVERPLCIFDDFPLLYLSWISS